MQLTALIVDNQCPRLYTAGSLDCDPKSPGGGGARPYAMQTPKCFPHACVGIGGVCIMQFTSQ